MQKKNRMEIKETEIREIYKKKTGFNYFDIPMKYMKWKKDWKDKKIKELKEKNEYLRIIRDDPESYPDKSISINYKRCIWPSE